MRKMRTMHAENMAQTASRILANARRVHSNSRGEDILIGNAESSPAGAVDPRVMPALENLMKAYGYRLIMAYPEPGNKGLLGQTNHKARTVTLRPDLSSAGTARVACHELAHIILQHWKWTIAPASLIEAVQEDPAKEMEAELTAGLVTDALAIHQRFTPLYLGIRYQFEPPREIITLVRQDAEQAARVITSALSAAGVALPGLAAA